MKVQKLLLHWGVVFLSFFLFIANTSLLSAEPEPLYRRADPVERERFFLQGLAERGILEVKGKKLLGTESLSTTEFEDLAQRALKDGHWNEAISLYDQAAEDALRAGDYSKSFRLFSSAARIAEQRIEETKKDPKVCNQYRYTSAFRFLRLGLDYPEESLSNRFGSLGIARLYTLCQEGLIERDEYARWSRQWLLTFTQRLDQLASTGKSQEALDQYAQLLREWPGNTLVLSGVARLLSMQSDPVCWQKALDFWNEVLRSSAVDSSEQMEARRALLDLYERLGKKDQAEKMRILLRLTSPQTGK